MATLLVFRNTLTALLSLSLNDERYTYISIIPLITLALVFLDRDKIFAGTGPSRRSGILLFAAGVALYAAVRWRDSALRPDGGLPLLAAGTVLVWSGLFVFRYGTGRSGSALFPLFFLALMIPLPPAAMDHVAGWLQKESADASYALFRLTGVPIFRQGFLFSLPGLDIQVAEQCSGIRSSISLFIARILAGQLVLQSTWKKVCLAVVTIPIVIFKNALRIVVLSLLGAYVNRDVLMGRLHTFGGLVFSPLALLALACLLFWMHRSESKLRDAEKPR